MLPTFVIGLREGLEASLIVGIIAAFLVKQGRRDVLRWVFVGVGAGVLLCTGVGVLLRVISQNLPQRQQEGRESVIGAIAVLMVTYMVVWMKRHSRDLKGQLEGAATSALAVGSGFALVAMAFLAVMREGFETVVFLLAAFNESSSGSLAGLGALLGIAAAVTLGYGIYRGGVRLNLSRFFRATGLVLVLVAGGLVVNALRTAHEAGWLNIGQQATLDLSAVVRPGSIQASLLTGMLGVQNHPALIEMVGWLVYVIPVGIYVAWPPGKAFASATLARVALVTGGVLAAAAVLLVVLVPTPPATDPVTTGVPAQVRSRAGDRRRFGRRSELGPRRTSPLGRRRRRRMPASRPMSTRRPRRRPSRRHPARCPWPSWRSTTAAGCRWECARTPGRRRYRSRCSRRAAPHSGSSRKPDGWSTCSRRRRLRRPPGCRSVRSCWPMRLPRRAAGRPQSPRPPWTRRERTSQQPVGTVCSSVLPLRAASSLCPSWPWGSACCSPAGGIASALSPPRHRRLSLFEVRVAYPNCHRLGSSSCRCAARAGCPRSASVSRPLYSPGAAAVPPHQTNGRARRRPETGIPR